VIAVYGGMLSSFVIILLVIAVYGGMLSSFVIGMRLSYIKICWMARVWLALNKQKNISSCYLFVSQQHSTMCHYPSCPLYSICLSIILIFHFPFFIFLCPCSLLLGNHLGSCIHFGISSVSHNVRFTLLYPNGLSYFH
jgi:hypothetical protein